MLNSIGNLFAWFVITLLLLLTACNKDQDTPSALERQLILSQLANNYERLPEQEVAVAIDSSVFAQYAAPTEKYRHGILGDRIEAKQLIVVQGEVFHELTLDDEYVFEDIRPRLFDVDDDGTLEIVCIRTHILMGAGIVVYKIVEDNIVEYAHVPVIGRMNRWLNIVAIDDLDADGIIELLWIETPHIGGKLKIAKLREGTLQVIDEVSQYSNHAIGDRNLCLSQLTDNSPSKVIYVPSQGRNKIVGFTFENDNFQVFKEIDQQVDFSEPLHTQYNFSNPIRDEVNCIDPE